MIRITLSLVVLALTLALVGCYGGTSETGMLEGTVTIGPIWPVEPPGGSPPIPPEVYSARKVMVYDKDGSRLVERVDLGPDGHYRVELKADTYVVDINYLGVDSSPDVPGE